MPYNLGVVVHRRQHILVPLWKFFEDAVQKHRECLKVGFRLSIVQRASKAADDQDIKAIDWWLQLPALAEESSAQDFLASIPKKTHIQLMLSSCTQPRKRDYRKCLHTLLRSCEPGSLAVGLDENERKTRLLVCLHAIHHIAHASVDREFEDDVIGFVRSNFANMAIMWALWADSDVGIRITSRSICALLARCILRGGRFSGPDLGWLQDVTGEPSNTIFNPDIITRDHMNLKAFVYGLLSGQEGDLPTEHATSFTETLAILMDAGTQPPFDRLKFEEELSSLIDRTQHDSTEGSEVVVGKLRRMFKDLLPASAPASTHLPESTPHS